MFTMLAEREKHIHCTIVNGGDCTTHPVELNSLIVAFTFKKELIMIDQYNTVLSREKFS